MALVVAGVALLGLTILGAFGHPPGLAEVGSPAQEALFTIAGCLGCLVYFAAIVLVLRQPLPRRAVWLVLGLALAVRLVTLAEPPFRSSDVYRYVWDGMLQLRGLNPYTTFPADPALAGLRDAAIFPHINRADYALTIYPPFAQMVFAAVAWVSPSLLAMKAAMLGFELLAMLVMVRLLGLAGLDPGRVLIYAWNPVAIWEYAGSAHIDAAAIGLIALALLARVRGRQALAGAALACAVLVKFLPAALFPAFWRRWDWRMPLTMAALIVALYAVYIGAGRHVLGFLPGYASEEGLATGNGIYWLDLLGRLVALPAVAGRIWMALAAAGLGGIALWIMVLRPRAAAEMGDIVPIARDMAVLSAALVAAITPHYPWYFPWLALPCCLAPMPSVIWLAAAAFIQNHDPFGDYTVQMSCIYLPFFALAVIDLRRRHPICSAETRLPRRS